MVRAWPNLVVAALLGRQGGVGLHADQGQIGGGAHQSTQAASAQTSHGLLPQGQVLRRDTDRWHIR